MAYPVSRDYCDMIRAFRADCSQLIRLFTNDKNHDWESFRKLWESLKFVHVYDKKYTQHGMEGDFKKDTLQVAKFITLHDHFCGGMFLLFGLYALQDSPPGSIRLEFDEYLYILNNCRLNETGSKENKVTLAWMFATFIKENAFEYVQFAREYDMEGQHRAEFIYDNKFEVPAETPTPTNPKDWVCDFVNTFCQDLQVADNKVMKAEVTIKSVFPDLNLCLGTEDTVSKLIKSVTEENTAAAAEPTSSEVDDIGARRRKLKNRSKKIKHRNEKKEPEEKENPDGELKGRRGRPVGVRKRFFQKYIN